MKKAVIISLLIALGFAGCKKDEVYDNFVIMQEVTFGVDLIDFNGLKNTQWDFRCYPDEEGNFSEPKYAQIELKDAYNNATSYFPAVFVINNKVYTQSFKLATGVYTVTKFLLWSEHPLSGDNPSIIMATPEAGTEFSEYVNTNIPFDITIDVFLKAEIEIEVLCFLPQEYESFGFTWLELTEIVVREVCFFGDICANREEEPDYQEETAYGGNFEGAGSAWWYYFDTQGQTSQPIYAGQQLTDGNVTYENGQLIIDLGSWSLQNVDEPVKIQGYHNGQLPTNRPVAGLFDTYKGNDLNIYVPAYRFYVVHLDVEKPVNDPALSPFGIDDFIGSDYENVPGGLQPDMPAIFKIHAYRNGLELPNSPFQNLGDEDQPLCVKYPDRIRIPGEFFEFELWILVPDDNGDFSYKHYHTFTSTDDGPLDVTDIGEDGVIEFVLGNCNYSPTDLQLNWNQ
jgi:hypothetical protein